VTFAICVLGVEHLPEYTYFRLQHLQRRRSFDLSQLVFPGQKGFSPISVKFARNVDSLAYLPMQDLLLSCYREHKTILYYLTRPSCKFHRTHLINRVLCQLRCQGRLLLHSAVLRSHSNSLLSFPKAPGNRVRWIVQPVIVPGFQQIL
jgi:hypothetical protein